MSVASNSTSLSNTSTLISTPPITYAKIHTAHQKPQQQQQNPNRNQSTSPAYYPSSFGNNNNKVNVSKNNDPNPNLIPIGKGLGIEANGNGKSKVKTRAPIPTFDHHHQGHHQHQYQHHHPQPSRIRIQVQGPVSPTRGFTQQRQQQQQQTSTAMNHASDLQMISSSISHIHPTKSNTETSSIIPDEKTENDDQPLIYPSVLHHSSSFGSISSGIRERLSSSDRVLVEGGSEKGLPVIKGDVEDQGQAKGVGTGTGTGMMFGTISSEEVSHTGKSIGSHSSSSSSSVSPNPNAISGDMTDPPERYPRDRDQEERNDENVLVHNHDQHRQGLDVEIMPDGCFEQDGMGAGNGMGDTPYHDQDRQESIPYEVEYRQTSSYQHSSPLPYLADLNPSMYPSSTHLGHPSDDTYPSSPYLFYNHEYINPYYNYHQNGQPHNQMSSANATIPPPSPYAPTSLPGYPPFTGYSVSNPYAYGYVPYPGYPSTPYPLFGDQMSGQETATATQPQAFSGSPSTPPGQESAYPQHGNQSTDGYPYSFQPIPHSTSPDLINTENGNGHGNINPTSPYPPYPHPNPYQMMGHSNWYPPTTHSTSVLYPNGSNLPNFGEPPINLHQPRSTSTSPSAQPQLHMQMQNQQYQFIPEVKVVNKEKVKLQESVAGAGGSGGRAMGMDVGMGVGPKIGGPAVVAGGGNVSGLSYKLW